MFVGISDYLRYARQRSNLLRRPLRVTASHDNLAAWIFAMNAADGRASILICECRHRACVQNDNLRLRRRASSLQSPFAKLPLNRGSIRLRGPAAEIFYVESSHVVILPQHGEDSRQVNRVIFVFLNSKLPRTKGTLWHADFGLYLPRKTQRIELS